MSNRVWPDGDDPVAAELRRALDEAQQRIPDDVTLRRGWAAIGSRPTTGRRAARLSWFAGGVASTAALALACAAWLWPRVVETPRRRTARKPGKRFQSPATSETRRLTLDGGVEAELQRTSVMRIEGSDARVEDGAVRFKVPKRRPGHPFVVRAETYPGDRAGDALRRRRRRRAPGRRRRRRGRRRGLERRRATGAPRAGPALEQRAAAADKAPARRRPANRPTRRRRSWSSRGPSRSTRRRPRRSSRRPPSCPGARRTTAVRRRPTAAGAWRCSARRRARAPRPRARPRAALAAGDAPRALEIYKNLAQKTGPVAENASYEIGRIQNERGQPAAAVATWRRYRSDYPNGILRVEADVSIIETLAKAGDTDEALTEATDFLRRRPDSERRGEIARVAGDLYRARGDCRHAIGAYQVAQSASRARDVVEAATFYRAACLVRIGEGNGIDAVRSYVRAYPEGRFRRQANELVEQATSKTSSH